MTALVLLPAVLITAWLLADIHLAITYDQPSLTPPHPAPVASARAEWAADFVQVRAQLAAPVIGRPPRGLVAA